MRKPLINSLLPKTDHDHREYWKLNPGKFGRFGGKFVPETLITCLRLLEAEFNFVLQDTKFQVVSSLFYLLYN